MPISIVVSESAMIATALSLLLFNCLSILTTGSILLLWLAFCVGVLFALEFLSRFSFVPGQRWTWMSEDPLDFCWLVLTFALSSSALLAWRGAVAGHVILLVGTVHVREGVKHWGNLSRLAKGELISKALGLLLLNILQAAYFCTFDCDSSDDTHDAANLHEHLRQIAVVATLSSAVDVSSLVLNIVLHCGGLEACDRLQQVLFPESEGLRYSLLDPSSPSFSLLPSFCSLLVVVSCAGFYTILRPCMLGQLILTAGTFSLHKTKLLLHQYRKLMDSIPLTEVHEEVVCTICMDAIRAGQLARQLRCRHLFHGACIRQWMTLHRMCPVCRTPIVSPPPPPRPNATERAAAQRQSGIGEAGGEELIRRNPYVNLLTHALVGPRSRRRVGVNTLRASDGGAAPLNLTVPAASQVAPASVSAPVAPPLSLPPTARLPASEESSSPSPAPPSPSGTAAGVEVREKESRDSHQTTASAAVPEGGAAELRRTRTTLEDVPLLGYTPHDSGEPSDASPAAKSNNRKRRRSVTNPTSKAPATRRKKRETETQTQTTEQEKEEGEGEEEEEAKAEKSSG